MIIELLLKPIGVITGWVIGALPVVQDLPNWLNYAIDIIGWGLCFFPADVWALCFANISFWMFGSVVWALVEWAYKKIPGVS